MTASSQRRVPDRKQSKESTKRNDEKQQNRQNKTDSSSKEETQINNVLLDIYKFRKQIGYQP